MLRFRPILFALLGCAPALAQQNCLPCHTKQVEAFAKSGMGNAMRLPEKDAAGKVEHELSATKLSVIQQPDGMHHRVERNGLTEDQRIRWAIGSGKVGHSYVIQVGEYLFESPVSYYAQRGQWDVSPGYQLQSNPDFDRPITTECLFCHAGDLRTAGTPPNRFADPPFASLGISCERCHGPAGEHQRAPSRRNIVNPAKLPERARDSVCEQCHLGGEARILNPGRKWHDFTPGHELETVFTVYVNRTPANATLKVVSQVEQLAQSRCARESGGKLWCATCHDPHDPKKLTVARQREVCLSCHNKPLGASHPKAEDCASCHMPRTPTPEIAHTAYTDHRIRLRPEEPSSNTAAGDLDLVAWREPASAIRLRNLGLAYLGAAGKQRSLAASREGVRLLTQLEEPPADDPPVLEGLGLLFLKQSPADAVQFFRQALLKQADNARHALNLGIALEASGDGHAAVEMWNRAIAIDPSFDTAYLQLAEYYQKTGQADLRRETLQRYLKFMPQSLIFRDALK